MGKGSARTVELRLCRALRQCAAELLPMQAAIWVMASSVSITREMESVIQPGVKVTLVVAPTI